jgi:sigma-E factor negative regulatory protein RseA
MTKMQDLDENLSSFMDGELDDHRTVLDKLKNCAETKACWLRYHLIRDTIRDSRAINLSADFSGRVMRALDRDPVIINPRFSGSSLRRRLFRPVAGLAIAASVAAVTVFTMRAFYMSEAGFELASGTAPAAGVSSFKVAGGAPRVAAADRQNEEELNSYLLEHMEHSAAGVQGMMPYVRLAGFEDSQ